MTFHPVTNSNENIALLMEYSIIKLLSLNLKVLITYPNNDVGVEKIIEVINKFSDNNRVIIKKNLGAEGYYSAIYNSKFVIGNSSSGVIEVPYFNKISINLGNRQEGRDTDSNVWNCKTDKTNLDSIFEKGKLIKWKSSRTEGLYGEGNSCEIISNIIRKDFEF